MIVVQFIINGIVEGLVGAGLAVGLFVSYRILKFFDFSYAIAYLVGGYTLYFVTRISSHLFLAFIVVPITCTIVAILSEWLVQEPLFRRGSPFSVRLIASIGYYILIVNIISIFIGNEVKTINQDIGKAFTFTGVMILKAQVWEILMALSVIIAACIVLNTKLGLLLRALAENFNLAYAMGLNVPLLRFLATSLSCSISGLLGAIMTYDVGIHPHSGMPALIVAVVGMLVGGASSIRGVVFGGLAVGIIRNGFVAFVPSRWSDAVVFSVLLIFLAARSFRFFGEPVLVRK